MQNTETKNPQTYEQIENAILAARGRMASNTAQTGAQDLRLSADQFLTDVTANLQGLFKPDPLGVESLKLRAQEIINDNGDHVDYKTRMTVKHLLDTDDQDLAEVVSAVEGGDRFENRGIVYSRYWSFSAEQSATKEAQAMALTDYVFGQREPMDETELAALLVLLDMIGGNEDLANEVKVKLFWHSNLRHDAPLRFIRGSRDRVLSQVQAGQKITEGEIESEGESEN